MRAHFAGEVVVANGSCDNIESEPLEARIDDFKRDSQNMEVLTEFVDDVLQKAEKEALKKQEAATGSNGKSSQQPKEKRQSFAIPDFKNGKVVNRARGLVVRIFDAICNCANSAAAPAQRIKLRSKRGAAQVAANKEKADDEKQQQQQDKKNEQEKQKESKQQAASDNQQKQ